MEEPTENTSNIEDPLLSTPTTAHEQPQLESEQTTSSTSKNVFGAVVNLCATTMGGGILLLPIALSYAGWVGGTLTLIFFAGMTEVSMQLLLSAAISCNVFGYEALGEALFGRGGELAVKIALLLLLIGACITTVLTVGEVAGKGMQKIVGEESALANVKVLTGAALVVISPVAAADSLQSLRHTSSSALISLFVVFFIMLYFFFHSCSISTEVQPFNIQQPALLPLGIPLQSLAFCSQFNVLPIYGELDDKSKKSMRWVIRVSIMGVVLAVYILFGIVGYFTAGNEFWVQEDGRYKYDSILVIEEYKSSDAMTIGLFAVAATNLFKFPLLLLPLRSCFNQLCLPKRTLTRTQRVLESMTMLVFLYIAAITLSTLTMTMELVGITSGPFICFILPGLFHWRSLPEEDRGFPWFMVLGVLVLVITIVFFVVNQTGSIVASGFVHNSTCSAR